MLGILCWLVPVFTYAQDAADSNMIDSTTTAPPHAGFGTDSTSTPPKSSQADSGKTDINIELGIKGGLTKASFDFRSEQSGLAAYKTGVTVGVIARIHVAKWLVLQPELAYVQRGTNALDSGEVFATWTLSYLDIPLLAAVSIPASTHIVPYVIAGPTLGLNLDAKSEGSGRVRPLDLPSLEVAATVGAGTSIDVTPAIGVTVEVRYDHGFTQLFETRGHNRALTLAVGSTFSLRKDSDGDGIDNRSDRCWDEPETRNGFQDNDGCPDSDIDGDQIADAVDACTDQKEIDDKDGFKDGDGCIDDDNDGDGIKDDEDKAADGRDCRNEFFKTSEGSSTKAGCFPSYEGFEVEYAEITDSDGIRRIEQIKSLRLTDELVFDKDKIALDTNKDASTNTHKRILSNLSFLMKDFPDTRILIRGHASGEGNTAANELLSQKRADAAREYLISQGIDACRLVAKDFGETKPIAHEDTPEAKQKNRRVDFELISKPAEDCESKATP